MFVVSGSATDSPCGVWGRGWNTCLLHDSPLCGSHFKMRVGMEVWSDNSYIHYYFLPRFTVSCMKLVTFNSIITLSFTKYFVHSYTVHVVFTVFYCISYGTGPGAYWYLMIFFKPYQFHYPKSQYIFVPEIITNGIEYLCLCRQEHWPSLM